MTTTFSRSLTAAALALTLGASAALAQESAGRPMFGAEFEFAGLGNRIPSFENQSFENYERIMRVIAEHYGGNARDIRKVEWKVPHPSGEGERTLFRAEWTDTQGRTWKIEPEYVATNGLDGYEIVTPPMEDSRDLREVLEKVRSSGYVREGKKSGVHVHVDGRRLITGEGNATGLINLINMHENYEPLLRRLFNPVRGGGYQNYFAQPLYVNHSELLNEISNLPEAERTQARLEEIFRRHVAKEMRVHGVSELNAEGWKKMWKYNNLNLKNILNINDLLPAEIKTVEFRMNDLANGQTHELQIELYRRLVERAAELAAQGRVVRYDRPADFRVPSGTDPARMLTPENPREAAAQVREMIESLGLDPQKYETLIERNIRPEPALGEREMRERVESLTRGSVNLGGQPATYGFELEGRGSGFAEIARPTDAEVDSRWDRMSSSEKKAYFERVVGENHSSVDRHFRLDTQRFPYLDGSLKVEYTGNWEIRSNVFESVGEATDKMREIKAATGASGKGFHLHMRHNNPNWEIMRAKGPQFADFIERASYWVWFDRVMNKRTDLSLKSWSNAPMTPSTLEGIERMSPDNGERHTLRVQKLGEALDIEIRGLTTDVNKVETLAKIITENLRTYNFGEFKYRDNILPHGGGWEGAPEETRFRPFVEEYLRTVEGVTKISPELATIIENLQETYPNRRVNAESRALPSNLGVPLLPWEAETSLSEVDKRTIRFAREEYLRRIANVARGVEAGKWGIDVNVSSREALVEGLGIKTVDAELIIKARRAAGRELKTVENLVAELTRASGGESLVGAMDGRRITVAELVEGGVAEAEARRIVRIRDALNTRMVGQVSNLDYKEIERQTRLPVKTFVEESRIREATFRTLLPKSTGEVGEGFANRRTVEGETGPRRISSEEVRLVFESMRGEVAERVAATEGLNPERVRNASLEIISGNELVVEYLKDANRIRVSEATINEIYNRSLNLPETERVMFRRKALGLLMGHELAHAGGVKAERVADATAVEALKRAEGVGRLDGLRVPITRNDIAETLRVFERPLTGSRLSNVFYRLRQLPQYGTLGGREAALARAAAGEADPYSKYRRADGTLKWSEMTRDGALKQGAGAAHFALALFLKELAVVVQTGDRLRIEEFFDGLMTTDFYVHYGLFVAGAQAGNVAYSKFLERYIKPTFVNGILKTNVVLATGMALPMIVSGHFDGRAFAIDVAALGLSTVAVKAGLQGLGWVVNLKRAEQAGQLARTAAKFRRFAGLGGWFYTAAETAVVLYLGEEISKAVNHYIDDRAARNSIEEATGKFFDAVGNGELTEEQFLEAVQDFDAAHNDYRAFLYKPLMQEEQLYMARLGSLAETAKRLDDKRTAALERLEKYPALKAAVERQHGSVEAYAAALVAEDEAELDAEMAKYLESYQLNRDRLLDDVYKAGEREGAYITDSAAMWVLNGAVPGAAGDPYGGRTDFFANRGRRGVRDDVLDDARDVSSNKIQAYDDQIKVVDLAIRAEGDEARREVLQALRDNLVEMQEMDRGLGQVSSDGATSILGREIGSGEGR